MRWLISIIAFAITLTTASAQRPWSDYDARQRSAVLTSSKVPNIVRRSVDHLDELSSAECEQLWGIVTSPTRDKHLRSLYLYLYELLRPMDGSAATVDVAMLERYPAYFFKRWSEPLHCYDVYNYSYAIGRSGVQASLRKAFKGRYARRYGAVVTALRKGVVIAESSARLGCSPHYDDVVAAVDVYAPREITIDDYTAAVCAVEPLCAPPLEGELDRYIASEFITWDGCYNRVVEHSFAEVVSIVASMSSGETIFSLRDARGDHLMLADSLYLLPDGELFAIDGGDVIFGYIDVGGLHIVGRVAMDVGELCEVKCGYEGIYLKLRGATTRYYMLRVGDYERD